MKKQILSVLFALALLLCIPVAANAASSGKCGANVTWTLDDNGTLTISGTGEMENYSNSNSLDPPWYGNRSSITKVIIEQGVTSIGSSAFRDCTDLESITIPDSVTYIGYDAFAS